MMLLMYRHGLRETELCRLTVSALDLETARISERADLGKVQPHMSTTIPTIWPTCNDIICSALRVPDCEDGWHPCHIID